MSGQQFFSEKEVGEIVKRAAELQERTGTDATRYVPGVSREELARVAREMGIDSSYLDRAIQERLEGPGDGTPHVLGVAFAKEFEKVIPGELPLEDFDVVMEEIGPRRRSHFASQVGRMLTSQVTSGIGIGRLQVSSRDGRTRLRVRSFPLFAALITLYPAFIATIITCSNLAEHMPKSPGWWYLAIVAGAFVVGWSAFMALARRGHASIRDLTERIAARIAQTTALHPATEAQADQEVEQRS